MTSPNNRTDNLNPSIAVIEQIAETKHVKPADLTPLHRAVDPDALDALFDNRFDGDVRFIYEDQWVTVSFTNGELSVNIESQDE